MTREPDGDELALLRLIAREGTLSHEDARLDFFCDDGSSRSGMDAFNRCHKQGWLKSTQSGQDDSFVRITEKGRLALSADDVGVGAPRPPQTPARALEQTIILQEPTHDR